MLFNSFHFLMFFPIVILIYFIIPDKVKYLWLLGASYFFYMSWNAKYGLLLLFSTLVTYLCGLLIDGIRRKEKTKDSKRLVKTVLGISIILSLSTLFYFKYVNFALSILGYLTTKLGISFSVPYFDIVLPVGISFFTFQAIGYAVDVYRGDIYAEKNFFKYALFVSFFPQLVAGPIERSKNLLKQLSVPKKFDFELAREGLLLMIWGYFLKMVLADRIAIFVDTVYGDFSTYQGWYIIVATILFGIQIYCDFAGYSIIAMGAAKVLGVQLMENFDAPYLSTSVSEFWRKWHISLTSWFKDYLYIPLGGNRKGKIRKYINILIVFLVSGLWHGASMAFVFWGGLNGLYQVIGSLLMPIRKWICKVLALNEDSLAHKAVKVFVTFGMVDFAWLFFRAGNMSSAKEAILNMIAQNNYWILFDGSLYECGLNSKNFIVMVISILILLGADLAKKRGIIVRNIIIKQDYWARWLAIAIPIVAILIFGVWGNMEHNAGFIYFQF